MIRSGIIKLFAFICLTALAAVGLHCMIGVGLRKVSTSTMGSLNRAMQGRGEAEVLISGSSRASSHYDPRIIHRVTGRTAFNLGRDGSRCDVQYAMLQAYLKRNRKPEFIIQNLDMHSLLLTPQDEINDASEYVPHLHCDELFQGLRRINPRVWKWKHVPLYGYVVDDMSLTWIEGIRRLFGSNPQEDHFDGFSPEELLWTDAFDRFKAKHPNGVRYGIDPAAVQVMENLIETCKSNQIAVVLVYSPQYHEMLNLVTNRAEVFGTFREIADRHNVLFWDYSDTDISRNQHYFRNSQHLNRLGAEEFSSRLANRLNAELFSPNQVISNDRRGLDAMEQRLLSH
jgi:hypothetical protein